MTPFKLLAQRGQPVSAMAEVGTQGACALMSLFHCSLFHFIDCIQMFNNIGITVALSTTLPYPPPKQVVMERWEIIVMMPTAVFEVTSEKRHSSQSKGKITP